MRKIFLLLACSGTILASAQNNVSITPQQYTLLKQNGLLDLSKKYQFIGTSAGNEKIKPSAEVLALRNQRAMCSCLIPLDSSFSVVPFNAVDSSYNPSDHRNDDGYTDLIALPFTFNYFGTNYDSVYINNNGNISFNTPYYEYTPDSFPSSLFSMIAPFWGDVDTRDSLSGLVYYKITPTAMIVKWEGVGYYNWYSDKLNTFQLIITNGSDSLLPAGNNVGFCYGDMSWTTGDASGGFGGFYGVPATVGVNQGNGADYFQVGRFDQPGLGFDGPYNLTDSVDFLDDQEMYFNIAATGNIPPLVINRNICDTIDVFTGDTVRSEANDAVFTIQATTPEINQIVNVSFSCTQLSNFTYINTINTPTFKEYECTFTSANLAPGVYHVNITATDNGVPSQQTNHSVAIKVGNQTTGIKKEDKSSSAISLYPNPTDGFIYIKHNFNIASKPVLSLVNIIGETVSTIQLNNSEQGIDISTLPKGVYFATVTSKEGKSKSLKVVHR